MKSFTATFTVVAVMSCALLVGCNDNRTKTSGQDSQAIAVVEKPSNSSTSVDRNEQPDKVQTPSVIDRLSSTKVHETSISSSSRSLFWPIITLFALGVAAISSALAVWLFRWRNHLPDSQISIVPEAVMQTVANLNKNNLNQLKQAREARELSGKRYSEIQEAFGIFGATVQEKDEEIRRLRQGAEKQSIIRDLRRFVKVLRFIERDIAEDRVSGIDTKSLESIRDHLRDALLDSGLDTFQPEQGQDYRKLKNVADSPAIIETGDLAMDWTVAKTVLEGFQLPTEHAPIIVEKAKVAIYKFTEKGN